VFGFDAKLGRALGDATVAGFILEPSSPLRLETFLSALNRLFPEEVRPFVDDKEKFALMCELSWPTEKQQKAYANSSSILWEESLEPDTAPGFNVHLDPDFERILFEASDSSRLEPGDFLSIHDLLTLICGDEQASGSLRARWQVTLRAQR
jgi:hypothetical protein